MSDIRKLQRPEAKAMDASELGGGERELPSLEDPAAARERAGGELAYRASAGARGVAPMQRLMDERRALGGQLAARVQRKADGGGAGQVEIPEGGGSKLPDGVRTKMEPKLGADLSDVRVHTGGASAQAATGLGARAFTVGSDVHFNAGEFAPGSKEGDRLLAHELTHVVQGKKSGVQRKALEEGAAPGSAEAAHGGGEVSHPEEPAEKEADAVADGVADSLHAGGKKGAGKDRELGAQAHAAGGSHAAGGHELAGHEAAHVSQQGGGHAQGEGPAERPAPISAKFLGVGRKVMRAKKPSKTDPAAPDSSASSKPDDKPMLKIDAVTDSKADPPPASAAAKDPAAWTQYNTNWSSAFVPKLKENGIDDATITSLVPHKPGWFEDAYNACESGKDVNEVVDRIYAQMPKEPKGQERHFWSGGAPAQGMADSAIASKGAMPPKTGAGGAAAGGAAAPPAKAMRLETSHVGILFNTVFDKSKLKWKEQAINFWQRASTNFAKATTGTVTAHLNVDFKYSPDQKINREAIFGKFELGEIVANMKNKAPDGKETVVKALVLDLWVHGLTKDPKGADKNVDKHLSLTINAADDVSEKSILDAIDAQIKAATKA